MFQNPNMAYPNMLNFQMNTRPLDPSNQFQYTLQQQAQRVMYPYILNTNLPQTQPQIQTLPNNCYPTQINQTNANIINNVNNINNTNNQNSSNQDGSTTNAESNNQNNTQNSPTMSLLTKYKDSVFYAVDEQGVGELGSTSSAARLYRLRIGPMPDIDTAQKLCDQLLKFSGASCQVVRIQ